MFCPHCSHQSPDGQLGAHLQVNVCGACQFMWTGRALGFLKVPKSQVTTVTIVEKPKYETP